MSVKSNEVLQTEFENMKEQNNKEHKEIKEILTEIHNKIDGLPSKFVLRREFNAVSWVIWFVAVALAVIWFFINK